jgi:hypothetical protein
MVADLAADWNEHGAAVPERVRMTDPATYLRVAAVLVPQGTECGGRAKDPWRPGREEWRYSGALSILSRRMRRQLGPVLETIENALRADQAKLIEAQ